MAEVSIKCAACGGDLTAETTEELAHKLQDHAKEHHGIDMTLEMPDKRSRRPIRFKDCTQRPHGSMFGLVSLTGLTNSEMNHLETFSPFSSTRKRGIGAFNLNACE